MRSSTGPLRRWFVLVSVAALLALTGAVLVTWHDGGNGSKAHRNAAIPKIVWQFEAVKRGGIASTPLVTADRVFVAVIHDAGLTTHGTLYCLDRASGKVIWQFDDDGQMQQMFSTPCIAEGRIYLGEGMHQNRVCKLYCIDAVTGKKNWQFHTNSHIESSPIVAGGKVIFGAGDEGVFALDASTGRELWHFNDSLHVDTSPAVAGTRLYAGSGRSRTGKPSEVFCLDTETGKPVWRNRTDLPVWGSPLIDSDEVLFGVGNGRLLTLPEPPARPAGAVLSVSAKTGKLLWRWDGDGVFQKPIADKTSIYFGSRDGFCYCLNRDAHDVRWRFDLGSSVVARPALVDSAVYAISSKGRLASLEKADGKPRWTWELGEHTQTNPQIFSSPVVLPDPAAGEGHNLLFVATELSNSTNSAAVVYCLQD